MRGQGGPCELGGRVLPGLPKLDVVGWVSGTGWIGVREWLKVRAMRKLAVVGWLTERRRGDEAVV